MDVFKESPFWLSSGILFSALLSLFIKQRTYKIPNNSAGAELDGFSHRTQNDGAVSFKTLVCGWKGWLAS